LDDFGTGVENFVDKYLGTSPSRFVCRIAKKNQWQGANSNLSERRASAWRNFACRVEKQRRQEAEGARNS
jgi:hypothetical protein